MFTMGTAQLAGLCWIFFFLRSSFFEDKVQKIKSLKQQIAAVHSDTGKLKEARVECERLKHFLEKLTPPEWKEDQWDDPGFSASKVDGFPGIHHAVII